MITRYKVFVTRAFLCNCAVDHFNFPHKQSLKRKVFLNKSKQLENNENVTHFIRNIKWKLQEYKYIFSFNSIVSCVLKLLMFFTFKIPSLPSIVSSLDRYVLRISKTLKMTKTSVRNSNYRICSNFLLTKWKQSWVTSNN